MAPPPEYDKEPKAPDKSATTVTSEEIKVHTLVNDLPTFSDHKTANSASNNEIENNKHVESLDDGQLRALLDEAIQYKCPKDREGKSSLFKELLEEVEHQDEVSEAASRGFIARGGPHANSLQDLMAALKVESATRPVRHQPPPHSQTSVSARAIHGGSLPSGVDTSFLLAEEPPRGGYLATVRCVNPPPLAERRVSASDANTPAEMELLNKRSKPMFPMYTARASLEIGSGSVCSGRAVTTTTPSNQVRKTTPPHPASHFKRFHHNRTLNHHQVEPRHIHWATGGPPERIYTLKSLYQPDKPTAKQDMLLKALRPKSADAKNTDLDVGNMEICPPCSRDTNNVRVNADRPKKLEQFANVVENWYRELRPELVDGGKKNAKGSVNSEKYVGVLKPRGPDFTNNRKVANFRNNSLKTGLSTDTDESTNIEHHITNEANTEVSGFTDAKIDKVPIIQSKCLVGCKEDNYSNSKSVENITSPDPNLIKNTGKCPQNSKDDCNYSKTSNITISSGTSSIENTGKPPQNTEEDRKYTKINPKNVQKTISSGACGVNKTSKTSLNHMKRVNGGKKDIKCSENSMGAVEKSNIRSCDTNNSRVPGIHHSEYTKETEQCFGIYANTVDNWYKGLTTYTAQLNINYTDSSTLYHTKTTDKSNKTLRNIDIIPNIDTQNIAENNDIHNPFAPKFITNLSDEDNVVGIQHVGSNVKNKANQDNASDIREYRKKVGKIVRHSLSSVNPRNVRNMSIGKAEPINTDQIITKTSTNLRKTLSNEPKAEIKHHNIISHENKTISPIMKNQTKESPNGKKQLRFDLKDETTDNHEVNSDTTSYDNERQEMKEMKMIDLLQARCENNDFEHVPKHQSDENQFEMKNMSKPQSVESGDIEMKCFTNPHYKAQDVDSFSKFLANQENLLKCLESANYTNTEDVVPAATDKNNNDDASLAAENVESTKEIIQKFEKDNASSETVKQMNSITITSTDSPTRETPKYLKFKTENNMAVTQLCRLEEPKPGEHYVLAELSNNAYIFLTFPKRLTPPQEQSAQLQEIEKRNVSPNVSSALVKRKKSESNDGKKKEANKNSLRGLLLESLLKRGADHRGPAPPASGTQVDSTIPFSCITTPEVVASCNTTSSTVQSAVAVDPKPRSVMSSTFNGLPLSRPNYGATASAAADEYKKSLDENGNAVQGIGSPISGSSQHKKPRRKKSSKNETVIKSHQIDGYQGNKDLNEVLRFIESNADAGRQGKLRGKHKDDDDKGKKRSAERRKDKEKVKRASSLEELSRTKLEDLTDAPEPPPAKPERRSWGDDARDSFYFRGAEPEPTPAPDADFQTVTKRRKPRRRDTEHERPERDARRARLPEPRARRESAPPSDRSADSNDDMDSVHSLPAPARAPLSAPAPAHASYADIARTRHNIPDLIESCNFYAEGEGAGDARRADPAPTPIDADGYPALEARAAATRRATAKPSPPSAAAPRRDRKERAPAAPPDCPAPDVVADRRPPVILLDSAARPRDMDGVTFGFDINEQLLGAPARPRVDLLRDAAAADAGRAVLVAGCALRYVPPHPPPDTLHLHQIIDYVGAAWEDVIRCGAGKVRYFSE